MILIVGGAYQGKSGYADEHFPGRCRVEHLERQILEEVKAGRDPLDWLSQQLPSFKDAVLLCEDISCGVVPVTPIHRAWREGVGRVCTKLAREADQVIRVFCGIGSRIK